MEDDGDDAATITATELLVATCIYVPRMALWIVAAPLVAAWLINLFWQEPLRPVSVATWRHGVVRLPLAAMIYYPLWWIYWRWLHPRRRALAWTIGAGGVLPMVVAWLHKLGYHAGRWLATGDADWTHEFVPHYPDAMVRSAFLLGVDDIVVGSTPYRTAGLAPTMQHWRMGALLTAQLALYTCVVYGALRLFMRVRAGIYATALRRRRLARRDE